MAQSSESLPQVDITSKEWEDLQSDVAQTYCRERMLVGAKGRMTFQKILVRSTNNDGGKTTIKYNAQTDAPAESAQSILPTREERDASRDRNATIVMLVVGLVIADEPMKYSNSGTLKGKEKEEQRKARGVNSRPDKVLRAVVQTSKYATAASFKYYVAIDLIDGLCGLRLIKGEAIFFFPEFLASLNKDTPIKMRQHLISQAVRAAAAAISEEVLDNGSHEAVSSDPNLAMSEDTSIEAAMDSPATTKPDSKDIQYFLNSDIETFTAEDARSMLQALQTTYSDIPVMNPATIVKVRQALQNMNLIERLSQTHALPLFLKMLNTHIDRVDSSQFYFYVQVTAAHALCNAED